MSIIRLVRCDVCGVYARNYGAPTVIAAREAATAEGWLCTKKDLCPDCRPVIGGLTQKDVEHIQERYNNPDGRVSQEELARAYGVSQHTIWRVVNKR